LDQRRGASLVRCHPGLIFPVERLEVAGMVFREVSVIEIREALRAWLAGKSERAVAAHAGLHRHRPLALAREPGPQRLTDLDHRHLPEHHPGDLQSLDWEDQTGMTPDKRRTTPLVQLLATGWSHAHGGKPLTWSHAAGG